MSLIPMTQRNGFMPSFVTVLPSALLAASYERVLALVSLSAGYFVSVLGTEAHHIGYTNPAGEIATVWRHRG